MPYKKFVELWAEEQLNPRGQEREDLRTALICLTIARSAGNKSAKLKDFQIKFGEPKQDTEASFLKKLTVLASAVNENIKRGK